MSPHFSLHLPALYLIIACNISHISLHHHNHHHHHHSTPAPLQSVRDTLKVNKRISTLHVESVSMSASGLKALSQWRAHRIGTPKLCLSRISSTMCQRSVFEGASSGTEPWAHWETSQDDLKTLCTCSISLHFVCS